MKILNISGYKFVPIEDPNLIQAQLRARCEALGIKGTILLAKEGTNIALAGTEPSIRQFIRQLNEDEHFSDLIFKESWSEKIPFRRLRVRVKDEIIMMRVPSVDPLKKTGKYIAPKELKAWLDENRDVVVLDTRNDYEIKVGTFENAIDFNVENFREFPGKLYEVADAIKDKPVVMFCTGGIRCEKATAVALDCGFKNVYQLDGGIIKYFEDCGGAHWKGECFVFDDRVAIAPNLQPSDKHYCLECLEELTEEDLKSPMFQYNKSCPHCCKDAAA